MNKEQVVRHQGWRASLVPQLLAIGQLATLVVVAIALLMPAPFMHNQLPAAGTSSDLIISHWPTALLIQRTFAQEHRLPLWNPYFGGGEPLAADPLAALFYPPTHLVHFLSLRGYYLVLIIGHLVFAGLGMLLLARRAVGLPRFPALVAAVSYMATPRLISHLGAGHITIVQTVAWLPWLALACCVTVREPRRWGALLGICFGLTLLAGHPQIAYYGLLMTTVLAIWLLVKRWRLDGRRAFLMSGVGLASAGVIGVLLAAIHLLPLMEFTARSTRQLSVSSKDGYPLLEFLHALIDQQPRAALPWEAMITPGLAVLALALLAVVTQWRKVWPLVLGVIVVAGLTMGNSSPFYLLVARILPDFDRFRGLARIWFLALVAISLLAGFGAESLLRGVRRVSFRATAVAGVLTVLVVAVTLIMTDAGYARCDDVRVATTPSLLARTAAQLADTGWVYGVQGNILQVSGVQLRTRLADGYNPLLIESYVSYMQRAGGYTASGYQLVIPNDSPPAKPNAALLGLMHVSVVVSLRPLTDPRLVRVGKANDTLIYKNTADAGPAYLIRSGPNGNPPSLDQFQRLNVTVHAINQASEHNTFTFSTSTAGYFVIATPWFPGWTADLDGHPAQIQQIADVLPAIKVGPGIHTLSYSYAPSSVRSGAILSAVGLLAALVWLIAGRRRRQGKPHSSLPS